MEDLLHEIFGLFSNPLDRQLSRTEYISNLRTFLDILNPDLIYQQMIAGANNYLESGYQATVSDETYALIKKALDNLQESGSALVPIWNALDHYEKYEIWNGVDENEMSGSAFWGAVVGTIVLPGVGTFLGAMFGQASSYARIESEVEAMTEQYSKGVAHFVDLYKTCVAEVILPAIVEDIGNALQVIEEAKAAEEIEETAALPEPVSTEANYLDELERLGELRRKGHIGWWEYRKKKKEILQRAQVVRNCILKERPWSIRLQGKRQDESILVRGVSVLQLHEDYLFRTIQREVGGNAEEKSTFCPTSSQTRMKHSGNVGMLILPRSAVYIQQVKFIITGFICFEFQFEVSLIDEVLRVIIWVNILDEEEDNRVAATHLGNILLWSKMDGQVADLGKTAKVIIEGDGFSAQIKGALVEIGA